MMRRVLYLFVVALAAVSLTGCRSGRRAVSATGGYGAGKSVHAIDYSREETDMMGEELAAEARRWLGTPYRYGGADRDGTDCSGLVMELYRAVCATRLPRTTTQQKSYCTKVARNKARVGDLMFFGSGKSSDAVSHVGLYIGKGEMIHASSSRGVMVSRVDEGYWGGRFNGVGRVEGAYSSWASLNRGEKSKGRNRGASPGQSESTPLPVPLPESVVPVTTMEIAYDRLDDAVQPAVPAGDGNAVAENAGVISAVLPDTPSSTAEATASINLLDLIINQKVDSIFSSSFMD